MASTIISHGSARSLENHARKMKWITDRCRGTHDVTNSESPHILCLTIVWEADAKLACAAPHVPAAPEVLGRLATGDVCGGDGF